MSRGYPDFFGQSMWPKYGTPIFVSGSESAVSGADIVVLDVSAQGILVWFEADITNFPNVLTGTRCRFAVDGVICRTLDCNQYSASAYSHGSRSPLILSYLDFIMQDAVFSNGIEIPFKTGFQISLINSGGLEDQTLTAQAMYYVIT